MPDASRTWSRLCSPVIAVALLVSGCAGLGSPETSIGTASHVDLDGPAMRQFAVANLTDLERDVRLETGAPDKQKKPVTPALFWSGIGLGTIGAVGGIAFGVTGFVTKNQLNDAYYDGTGLTVDEHERLVKNGELYNNLAITFSALAVVGYALAIITYGVDWNRCGPLADKKRRCRELGLGMYARP